LPLTIFDLDHTLITGDSDYLWGQYLVDQGLVDAHQYEEKNRLFFEDYEQGNLDIDSYLRFSLEPLSRYPIKKLYQWRQHFIENIIRPLIAKGTHSLLKKHRKKGDTLIIISATNLFITLPIAELLNIDNILGTEPEIKNNRYTGNYLGAPTYKHGKVGCLNKWMSENNFDLTNSTFYSDSNNDLPLLKLVTNPVAVNPDLELTRHATNNDWPIIDLSS